MSNSLVVALSQVPEGIDDPDIYRELLDIHNAIEALLNKINTTGPVTFQDTATFEDDAIFNTFAHFSMVNAGEPVVLDALTYIDDVGRLRRDNSALYWKKARAHDARSPGRIFFQRLDITGTVTLDPGYQKYILSSFSTESMTINLVGDFSDMYEGTEIIVRKERNGGSLVLQNNIAGVNIFVNGVIDNSPSISTYGAMTLVASDGGSVLFLGFSS